MTSCSSRYPLKIFFVILIGMLIILLTGCALSSQTPAQGDSSSQAAEQGSSIGTGIPETSIENTQPANVKKVSLNIYFPSTDNSLVLHEKREIEVTDGAIVRAAVNALLQGPNDPKMRKGIPDGAKLLGAKVVNKVAVLDFSKEFAQANDLAEIVERISVVNTIAGIPGVEKVRILIEGKDWIAPSGMPYGDTAYIKLNEEGGPVINQTRIFTLYFGNSNADAIVAEKREVTYPEDKMPVQVAFEELAKGPETKGLTSVIPEGTELLSAEIKNGICNLNLSHEFIDNCHLGTAGESMVLNSIVDTITEIPGINAAQFLIDGKKRDVFLHVVFNQPFKRNEAIIQK